MNRAVDEYDSADTRPVGHRRCQRRDDATVPRTIAAVVAVRTRNTLDGVPDGILDNVLPSDDDPDTGNDLAEGAPAAPGQR